MWDGKLGISGVGEFDLRRRLEEKLRNLQSAQNGSEVSTTTTTTAIASTSKIVEKRVEKTEISSVAAIIQQLSSNSTVRRAAMESTAEKKGAVLKPSKSVLETRAKKFGSIQIPTDIVSTTKMRDQTFAPEKTSEKFADQILTTITTDRTPSQDNTNWIIEVANAFLIDQQNESGEKSSSSDHQTVSVEFDKEKKDDQPMEKTASKAKQKRPKDTPTASTAGPDSSKTSEKAEKKEKKKHKEAKKKKHKDKDKPKDEKAESKKKKRKEEAAAHPASSAVVVPEAESKKKRREQPTARPVICAVVIPATVPSRWDDDRDDDRSKPPHHHDEPRLPSAVVRPSPAPSRAYSTFDRTRSPPSTRDRDRDRYRRPMTSSHSCSRQSLPPRSDSSYRPRPERESMKPRRTYTGYEYNRRSTSPVRLSTDDDQAAARPSPPKDMPEHIRWLHERWNKYDRTFFTGSGNAIKDGAVLEKRDPKIDDAASSKTSTSPKDQPSTSHGGDHPRHDSVSRRSSRDRRDFSERPHGRGGGSGRDKGRFSVPYYQFRKGGVYQPFIGVGGSQQLMSLKEFIVTQPGDLASDEAEALRLYEEYKMEYKRRMYADFFQTHQENEWFLEKYHPMFKAEKEARRRESIQKRLDVFMCVWIQDWSAMLMQLALEPFVLPFLHFCTLESSPDP